MKKSLTKTYTLIGMVSPRWGSLANDALLVIFRLYEAGSGSTGSPTVVQRAHQPWFDKLTNRGSTGSPTVVRAFLRWRSSFVTCHSTFVTDSSSRHNRNNLFLFYACNTPQICFMNTRTHRSNVNKRMSKEERCNNFVITFFCSDHLTHLHRKFERHSSFEDHH